MVKFYRHIDIRIDVEAKDENAAEQIFQDMGITASMNGEMIAPNILKYKTNYPVEIVDWDDLRRSADQ
jgi:antitoxin component of RelBE/YafQ-DinJ toxin-antitoxin module